MAQEHNVSSIFWQFQRGFRRSSFWLMIGTIFALSSCQFFQQSGQLVAREEWDTSVDILRAEGRSNYTRRFECSDVDEVAIRFVHINSGRKQVVSDEKHKRVLDTDASSCWFWLHTQGNAIERPQADFIFSEQQEIEPPVHTSVDQTPQATSTDFYVVGDVDPAQYQHRVSTPPMWTEIRMKESVFVYWYGAIPLQYPLETSSFSAARKELQFSSEQDIERFSRDREGSIFWVITLEPIR